MQLSNKHRALIDLVAAVIAAVLGVLAHMHPGAAEAVGDYLLLGFAAVASLRAKLEAGSRKPKTRLPIGDERTERRG